jgi:rhamnosyltransferase
VFSQSYEPYEVLIIDSSSTDETMSIAAEFPTRRIAIEQRAFGHGKTRNVAARAVAGTYVVFLSQDAEPQHARWLEYLIAPMEEDPRVAGVGGRHIARPEANPMEQFYCLRFYPTQRRIWNKTSYGQDDSVFSNANSACRRDLLLAYPFNETILMCEDREWAYRLLAMDYLIAYAPDAAVLHSHNHELIGTFKRTFDFGAAYAQINTRYTIRSFFKTGIGTILAEQVFLLQTQRYSWMPYSFVHNFLKFVALSLGKNQHRLPLSLKRRCSNYGSYWQ